MATDSPSTQSLRSPLAAQESNANAVPLAQLTWKTGTNQGPRKENQDCVLAVVPQNPQIASKGVLMLVCDGVGGEEGGHIAANAAGNEAMRAYYEEPAADPLQAIQIAIERAQLAVHGEATSQPRFGNMATTIVMAAICNDRLFLGHVGDSRAYIFRNGQLAQLTRDHTFVNAQVESGGMTVEQAKRSIYKSTLVRSLGARGNHIPDFRTELLQPGDRVLLCSDGLYGVVEDEQIAQLLSQHIHPNMAVNNLIGAAIANQTGDNVSVAVLGYGSPTAAMNTSTLSPSSTASAARQTSKGLPLLAIVAGLVGLSAIGLLAFGVLRGSRDVTPTPTMPAAGVVSISAPTQAPAASPTTVERVPAAATSEATVPPAPTAESVATPLAPVASATQATVEPDKPTSTIVPPTVTPTPAPTKPPPTRTPRPPATTQVIVVATVAPATTIATQPEQPTSAPQQPPPQPPPPPPQPTSAPPAEERP